MNAERLLRFSFSWLREKKAHGLILAYWLLSLLSLAFSGLLGLLFFSADLEALSRGNWAFFASYLVNPALLLAVLGKLLLLLFSLSLLFFLLDLWIRAKSLRLSLKNSSLPSLPRAFLRYLFLRVSFFLAPFFFSYSKPLFALLWVFFLGWTASFSLAFFSMAANPASSLSLFLLGVFLLFCHLALALYNFLRLCLPEPFFFSQGTGIRSSFRKSWELTRGKALKILLAWILISLLGLAAFLLVFVLLLIPFLLLGFLLGLVGSPPSPFLFQLAELPARLLFVPLGILLEAFFVTGLWGELQEERNKVPPTQAAPPKAVPAPVDPFMAAQMQN